MVHLCSSMRNSLVASDMTALASQFAPAKEQFTFFRNEATQTYRSDWVTLNSVIGDGNATLAWWDKVKSDPAKQAELKSTAGNLKSLLLQRGRFADVPRLYADPMAQLKDDYRFAQMVKETGDQNYDPFPRAAGIMYACYLAAGRDQDAQQIVAESLQLEDNADVRLALLETPLLIFQARIAQLKLIDMQLIKRLAEANGPAVLTLVPGLILIAVLVIRSLRKQKRDKLNNLLNLRFNK